MSATDFLKSEGASDGAIELLSLCLIDFYGEGLDSCSALFLLVAQWVGLNCQNVYCVRGGQEALPRAIAAALKDDIHYGSVLQRIDQDNSGVVVQYDHSGASIAERADYLVCAIPFPRLKQVSVSPPFSAAKNEVIRDLDNTSVTRIYVQTRTRFWESEHLSGEAQTQLPVMLVFSAFFRRSRRGILESYSSGPYARFLAGLGETQRNQLVLDEFARLFPGARAASEAVAHVCWDQEPFALGAYAWFKPGQFLKFLPQLTAPEGRVYFAGDQTTTIPGWMEGALLSGIRAAGQIAKASPVSVATAAAH